MEERHGDLHTIRPDRARLYVLGESIDEALDRLQHGLQKSIVFAAAGRLTRVTATIDGHILRPFIPKEFQNFGERQSC